MVECTETTCACVVVYVAKENDAVAKENYLEINQSFTAVKACSFAK